MVPRNIGALLSLLFTHSEAYQAPRPEKSYIGNTPQQSLLRQRKPDFTPPRAPQISPGAVSSAWKTAHSRPHIMFILLDDLGWSEAGFNQEGSMPMVPTPNMDALAAEGVVLKRHYVHKFCSPSRSAIQSGRNPIHVNVQNSFVESHNPDDPDGGFAGIPRNMTTIATVLKGAGYKTHMVGKWDVGVATEDHLPAGRGYDTSLIYFEHESDAWNFKTKIMCGSLYDLWEHDESIAYPGRPALSYMNDEGCSYENQADSCVYEDEMFEKRVTKIINDHDEKYPLFLFWATHAVHGPYQPPTAYKKQVMKWSSNSGNVAFFMDRTKYYGALAFIDDAIGRVVDLTKDRGFYDDMLIVLSSDNGGVAGASNEPLRGAKFTNWEGGIRAVSCVSGGKIPEKVRGTMQHGLIAGQDWYATFAHLAGVDPTDHKAATAKLPPVDSKNVWPLLSGQTKDSPRDKVVIGTTAGGYKNTARRSGEPRVSGVVQKVFGTLYKLVLGDTPEQELECGTVFGPGHKELEDPDTNCPQDSQVCGDTPETGCLFDLDADPQESKSVAMEKERVFRTLIHDLLKANNSVYRPNRGSWRKEDCDSMTNLFGGYLGPFNMKPGAIWGPMKPGHKGSVFDDDENWQHLQ